MPIGSITQIMLYHSSHKPSFWASHLKLINFRLIMKETSNSLSSWSICNAAFHSQVESAWNSLSWRQLGNNKNVYFTSTFSAELPTAEWSFVVFGTPLTSLYFLSRYASASPYSSHTLPSWLDSWVGRALHQYRRGDEFESPFRPDLFSSFNFTTARVVYITAMINHVFISFSAVQIYDLSCIHLHSSPSTGI